MSQINADVTLRRLVYEFEQWANAHKMVNDFGYGKYLEVFRSSGRNYGALIVNAPNFTIDEWYINFTFEFISLDYVKDEKDNKDRVNSDTAQILVDLEQTLRISNRWQSFLRLDQAWTSQKVDEFGADKAFGWVTTAVLRVKKRSAICNLSALLPGYDFNKDIGNL